MFGDPVSLALGNLGQNAVGNRGEILDVSRLFDRERQAKSRSSWAGTAITAPSP